MSTFFDRNTSRDMTMLEKFRQAVEAGKTAVADASREATAPEKPVVALLVLDAFGTTADGLRRRHQTAAKAQGDRALFILGPKSEHEHPDLDLLCEYLPLPEDLARATGERPDGTSRYVRTRLRLILDKWAVRECRWAGETAAELIGGWDGAEDATRVPVQFLPAR